MITKKGWAEFRATGLLFLINQILHAFGWAIVFEMDGDKIIDIFPARVKFRGFDNDSQTESYVQISEYMEANSSELLKESKE
jgi:hypothetical protein